MSRTVNVGMGEGEVHAWRSSPRPVAMALLVMLAQTASGCEAPPPSAAAGPSGVVVSSAMSAPFTSASVSHIGAASAAAPAASASAAASAGVASAPAAASAAPSGNGVATTADAMARLAGNADRAIAEALRAMGEGRYAAARALLIASERKHPKDVRLAPLIERACDEDPAYAPSIKRLRPDRDVTAIKRLGGGKSITLKLMNGKHILGVLKPAQRGGAGGYQGEIASWRLCPLIRCGFHIAYNRRVALLKADFDMLYGRIDDDAQRRYGERFSDLLLHPSKDGRLWVQGALEDWVANFALFPIERTAAWSRWLNQPDHGGLALAALADAALDDFTVEDTRGHEGTYKLFSRHLRGSTRRQLARQLSNVIAFDFLVSNWDRFSTSPRFVGANCQVRRGRIVSIDNGAAFPLYPQRAPGERLKLVQRFSHTLVAAVRRLPRDRTRKRLFRHVGSKNKRRFVLFWKQREAFLSYVDGLIARYGEDRVLVFE